MKHTSRTSRTPRFIATAAGAAIAASAVFAGGLGSSTVSAEDPGVDCAEYSSAFFTADVDRLNPSIVRPIFTYDDPGPLAVCPYTVSFSLRDGDGDIVASSWTTMTFIESETESAAGAFMYLMPYEGCEWELWYSIEESLPIVLDSVDLCLDLDLVAPIIAEPVVTLPAPSPWWRTVIRSLVQVAR